MTNPTRAIGPRAFLSIIFLSTLALVNSEWLHAQPASPREETWVTNGQVYALERVGDILYVGGNFTYHF